MKYSTAFIFVATSLFCSVTVLAQEPYVGISIATPGEGSWQYAPGKFIADNEHKLSKKLYGGWNFTNQFSLEAGYLSSGYHFQSPEKNTTFADLNVKMLYSAGKVSMPLGNAWNVFGKLGVAQIRSEFRAQNENTNSSRAIRPLLGFGLDFKMTQHLDMSLEFERDGKINHVPQQKLEAGLKWRF
jgi:hypothetical protein